MPKINLTSGKKQKAAKALKTKPQRQKIQKTPKAREVKTKKAKAQKAPVQLTFEQELEKKILAKFASCEVGIYEIGEDLSVKTLLGEPLANMAAERYFSIGETTVFINPLGIYDDGKYRNRFVTRFYRLEKEYLLTVSSYGIETFRGKSQAVVILDILGGLLL
jgi:hypothetical protein